MRMDVVFGDSLALPVGNWIGDGRTDKQFVAILWVKKEIQNVPFGNHETNQ